MKALSILIFLTVGVSMLTQGETSLFNNPVLGTKEAKHPIKVRYTNYRGETAIRTIIPLRFYVGATQYHPKEQWLLEVWDVERDALRVYALKDISQWFVK